MKSEIYYLLFCIVFGYILFLHTSYILLTIIRAKYPHWNLKYYGNKLKVNSNFLCNAGLTLRKRFKFYIHSIHRIHGIHVRYRLQTIAYFKPERLNFKQHYSKNYVILGKTV